MNKFPHPILKWLNLGKKKVLSFETICRTIMNEKVSENFSLNRESLMERTGASFVRVPYPYVHIR